MRAIAAGLTDVGRERYHNEDRFILLPQFNVYVVADGMGGHQSGEVASRMAATTVANYFRDEAARNGTAPAALIKQALADANSKIHARADDSRAHRGMGTTVVAAAYSPIDRKVHIAHAGDSRAYLIRNGEITQLTRDHSLLSDALLERPELTESDLSYLPKNVITRALGIGPTVELDELSVDAELGDVYLLCSDGLHGHLEGPDMIELIGDTESLTAACERLIDEANAQGGKDNITAVLVRIEEEDEPWSQRTPVMPQSVRSSAIRAAAAPSAEAQHHGPETETSTSGDETSQEVAAPDAAASEHDAQVVAELVVTTPSPPKTKSRRRRSKKART